MTDAVRDCTVVAMQRQRQRRKWVVVAGALAAGTLLVAAPALADIPDNGVFHGCVRDRRDDAEHPLRLIDTDARQTCRKDETLVTWNQTGPAGAPGPAGPAGPQGAPGASGGGATIFFNHTFQETALNAFPGVNVAHVSLGTGTYVVEAKWRYRNDSNTRQTASCLIQGTGISGLEGSQQNVDGGGEQNGQVDGVILDIVTKQVGADPDIHIQCFGPGDGSIHVINPNLVAIQAATATRQ